jgi:hypothetical protein
MKNMKKSFFALSFVLICFFVIVAGCIEDSTGGFNPKGKNISEFKSGGAANVPIPENYSQFIQVNCSMAPPLTASELVKNSNLAFYGTFKDFSSYGSASDPLSPKVFSDVVFIINDPITGTSGTEAVICLEGGEMDGIVVYYDGPPSPWDFKQGNEYLIYACESDSGDSYYILPGGIFNVEK